MIKERDLYVERPELLKQISDIFDRKESNEQYFIMYGAKGVGKSTIAERAAKGRKGVMMIRMTTASSRNDVMLELTEVLKVRELKPKTTDFISALNKAKSSDGTLPTIIVEIEIENRLDKSSGIKAIRGVAKDLSAVCNFLIILSEANAVLEFGNDMDREKFIYVGELTEPEAREYISKLKMELSEKDIKHVMDNVGTNPATIRSMEDCVCRGQSIQDFVVMKLTGAKMNLVAFPHKAILKALKEHPEGVSPEYFNNMKNEGIDLSDPVAVGNAMKLSNAIMYRIEEQKYMIITRCHQTALKTYKPTVAK